MLRSAPEGAHFEMMEAPERRAVITGMGMTDVGRRMGRSRVDLTLEAVGKAISDAGLTPKDIDGLAVPADGGIPVPEYLGLELNWKGAGTVGGPLSDVIAAFLAVGSGLARHVLVYRTMMMMGGDVISTMPAVGAAAASGRAQAPPTGIELGAGSVADITYHSYSVANVIAMHVRRHMHMYGTTKEQLGWIATTFRHHAGMNERAVYRDPLTMDDYMGARMISDPLGLYDCDVPIEGSAAFVISNESYSRDCPNPAVRVNAIGASARSSESWDGRPDLPRMAADEAAQVLWNRSELEPSDIDICQIYDGFSWFPLAWLEALGIVGRGESGPFVEGGSRIRFDGELPINTYGGQLSGGRLHSVYNLHEACLQLRGQAGARQVHKKAEVAVVSAGGGPLAGCFLLTKN